MYNLNWLQVVGITLLSLCLIGCGSRNNSEHVFNEEFQTPKFSLDSYKSPELRNSIQDKSTSVAVAISGGGHRAGNFGIGVLKELENLGCGVNNFNVLKEIDYLSTVSGGGLAAGVYISTLYDHIQSDTTTEYSLTELIDTEESPIKRNLERGYHNKLARALISIKSIGNYDRGDFLEREFDTKLLGQIGRGRSLTLGDIFLPKYSSKKDVMPLWVANATVYENGSIFPFHPMVLEAYGVNEYTHHLQKQSLSTDYYNLPISVAVKASASFPGVVPATTLQSNLDTKSVDNQNKFIHLFDGGLADNLGVYTAMQMLSSSRNKKKVLLVIDAYNGQPEPFSKNEGSPTILEILFRTTGISLDAWRIRHKQLIEQLSTSDEFGEDKVEVIYLAFDGLPRQLKEKVSKIGTSFNIGDDAQVSLFGAARAVVTEHKKEIVSAIFDRGC